METPKEIKWIKQVVVIILYYARPVDLTVLIALSTIAREQAMANKSTVQNIEQILDYLATNPNAKMRLYASNMIMNIYSDASYLSARGAKSRAGGPFFMGWTPKDGEPIRLNSAFFTLCVILKFVTAYMAEAELGALFFNIK